MGVVAGAAHDLQLVTRIREVGECALLADVDRPVAAACWIRSTVADRGIVVADIVPAARTVLVTAPTAATVTAVRTLLAELPEDLADYEPERRDPVRIAVAFDGPDLADVARRAGLDTDGVMSLLLDTELVVPFCGFSPGFAYLAGLPEQLHIPRRAEPRVRVPAGSLGLAGGYAAIYPRESPGGWNLVATTTQAMFDIECDPPARLTAGTAVRLERAP